ncbi:creatininase family protein [Rosistilla oblonga]|uniref:creatininase family protein n=1 Tax=Rosistilla oblonga TaxID=2527990 RepID=UPI003A970389
MKSILEEMTLADVRDADFRVAVLPFGATEPHNLHLPYGTDTLEGRCIGRAICDAANAQGGRVVLLPTIPYGTETNMNQLLLAMNLNPSTVLMVVKDLVESIQRAGIRKIVFLNSHGGNELKPVLRELHGQTNSQIFLCNWFQMVRDRYHEIFEVAEDHAGEMETSLALAYFPEFVVHNDDDTLRADAGSRRPMRFEALNEGWVSITRPWHLLTTNSGSGNPHAATADKGRAVMELIVQRIAPFLAELSQAELDDEFPFA